MYTLGLEIKTENLKKHPKKQFITKTLEKTVLQFYAKIFVHVIIRQHLLLRI